jgi:hypothetical protein
VDVLALEGEGGIARDDEELRELRQCRDDVFRDAVGEILLLRVAAHVGEGQDGNRQARQDGLFGRWGRCVLRLHWLADFERVDVDRLGDVLKLSVAEVADFEIKPSLDLPVGLLGHADRAGFGDTFEPRGDIDAVAHEVAVGLLNDIAQMDADTKLDAAFWRQAGVALNESILYLDSATHGVHHTAEFDDRAVAGALDDPAMMHGDRIDQIAA